MNNNRKKYVQINNHTSSDKIFALLDNVRSDEEEDIEELMSDSGWCFQVYAGIVNHIQHCYGIFTHTETFLRHIQVYFMQVSQVYSELCHRTLFNHIQNLLQFLHMQKPGMPRILEYSELFHNCFLTHIQNPLKDLRSSFFQRLHLRSLAGSEYLSINTH